MRINQPHTKPTFKDIPPNQRVNGSDFLDGIKKVYFAPGFTPDDIGALGAYNNSDWSSFSPILPPHFPVSYADVLYFEQPHDHYFTDNFLWPNVNTLLRVPQVVWLEMNIKANCYGEDPFWYVTDTPFEGRASPFTQPNLGHQEHLRLRPIFQEVQTTINELRQNRTWVYFFDWCLEHYGTPYNAPIEGSTVPLTNWRIRQEWTGVTSNFGVSMNAMNSGAGFIETPAEQKPFFGTNFLDIYVGDSLLSSQNVCTLLFNGRPMDNDTQWLVNILLYPDSGYSGLINFSDQNFIQSNWSIDATLPDAAGFWNKVYVERLLPNIDKFAGHSTRLFHTPDNWATWPNTNFGPQSNINFGILTLLKGTSATFNSAESIAHDDNIDITHPGPSSLITDAEYLVNLIAEHYNFDPETGKDLFI